MRNAIVPLLCGIGGAQVAYWVLGFTGVTQALVGALIGLPVLIVIRIWEKRNA